MANKLLVTPSPHVKSPRTTQTVMRDVLIALAPAVVVSLVIFKLGALKLYLTCVIACILFEYLYRKLLNKENTVSDLSAVVTGVLLAMNLPSTLPAWMAVVGSAFAIIVVKQLFGGIGQNFVNPAIAARVFMLVSFSTPMTTWMAVNGGVQAVAGATPLNLMKAGDTAALPQLADMILGRIGGSLGETCGLALIIGGIYLVARKIITPTIPLAFLATLVILSAAFGRNPMYDLFGGGALIGAIFMATDYTTSPATEKGKIIFGIGCGILTMVIRRFGNYPEGVSFAILLMNIIAPHIDNLCRTKPFGGVKAQ